ncbi:S-layer homology domain-containing protein [Solibacillus sp. FSL R7-0668]|uniref:S-layer homology domain-containing protein n=1 Tax=Solibacillus sp. FSL R7-0668 TaxID=2921688 RepID=UPI0030FAE059
MSKIKNRKNKITKVTMSTALVASSISFVAPLASAAQFADVKQTNTHYDAINELAGRGIINGYEDGLFRPENFVSRAQAAKIIAKTLNLDVSNVENPQFKDVNINSGYYPYIAALANAGIINGFDGKFNPSGNITRGQMSKIIARAFELTSTDELTFKDVPADHEFAPYISALAEKGITLGTGNGKFAMHELVTRGQLASFVTRAEKATAEPVVTTVSGTIDKISTNSVQIDGKTYQVSETADFLTSEINEVALQEAEVIATVKDNVITQVDELTVVNGGQFDAQGYSFAKLSLNQTLTHISNVKATEINHELPTSRVTYENVSAEKLNAYAAAVSVASLNNMVAIEQQTALQFLNSIINTLRLNARAANIEANAESAIQTIDAPNTSQLNLTGAFNRVNIPASAHIAGRGSVHLLTAPAQNLQGITVAPGFVIQQVNLNNVLSSWKEALDLLNQNQGNSGQNQGNNTTDPGTDTNPGDNNNTGGNTDPVPPIDTTEQDKITVNGIVAKVKEQLVNSSATNETTMSDISMLLNALATDGATITLTKYTMNQAQVNQAGSIEMGITIVKGNVIETFETAIAIVALPEVQDPETPPQEGNAEDQAAVNTVLAEVTTALDQLSVTNETTQTTIETVLIGFEQNGVEVSLSKFNMNQAQIGKMGNIDLEVTIRKGSVLETIVVLKEIAALVEEPPTQSGDQDQEVVNNALEKVQQLLTDLVVSNDISDDAIKTALAALQDEGVVITLSKYSLEKAKPGIQGSVTVGVTVKKGQVSETFETTKTIEALPEVVDPGDSGNTEEADKLAVQSVKQEIEAILANATYSNHTDGVAIEALWHALDKQGTAVGINNFVKTEATIDTAGTIRFEVSIVKNNVKEIIAISKEIAKLNAPPATEEVFTSVPVLDENQMIQFGGEERRVEQASIQALQSLQVMESTNQGAIQLVMGTSGDGETVALQAVTINAHAGTEVLNFNDIPANVGVAIIGDDVTEIQNLQNTQSVTIETAGAIAFTGDTNLNDITLTNATDVTGLVAGRLFAQNSVGMTFDASTSIATAEFTGVDAVSGLNATTAVFETNSSLGLSNVKASTITINDKSTVASNSFARVAAMGAVANTSTIKITVEGSTAEDFIISREDAIVDIQKNNVISNVTIKSNNTSLVMSEIGSLSVEAGVSYLRLGTTDQQAKISKLDLDLANDVHLVGNAVIAQLNIARTNTAAKVKTDSTITFTNTNNPDAIESATTYTLVPGTILGRYTIPSLPANTYYSLLTHNNTPAATMPIGQLKKYTTYMFLDSTIKQVALYDSSGKNISSIITDPLTRPAMDVFDISVSSTTSKVLINVTTPNLSELASRFKHFAVFTHGNTSGGYRVSEVLFERGTFSSDFKITPKSNPPHLLEVPAGSVSSISNVVIVASGYVYDSISSKNKDQKIEVLKSLAQHAKTNNDHSILYDYLTTTIAVDGKTYDSIFMDSIIDELLSNSITTIDGLIQFIENKGSSVTYNKIVSISELLLNGDIVEVKGDGTNSKVNIEGSNLLINSLADGTEIVTFKDSAGNSSMLKVVVNTAESDENKIKVELIKTEVSANTEILSGDARLATKDGKTYLIPATLGNETIIYTPNASSSVVGTFEKAKTDGNNDYQLSNVTLVNVSKEALNLTGDIARQTLTKSGYVTTDNEIHFYVIDSNATGLLDQYNITAGGKSTAVALVENAGAVSATVATKQFDVADLAIGQVKSIEPTTANTTMHTRFTANEVAIFAEKNSKNSTFKVTSQDNKISLINAVASANSAVELVNSTVVKVDLTDKLNGASIIAPKTAAGDLKEDIIRFVGNVAYATGTGKQRVVLSNGKQLEVEVVQQATEYVMTIDDTLSQTSIEAADLDLQNISTIQVNGTSATAVNVNNTYLSITAMANQSGKVELIVTDSDGKKAVVYVNVTNGALVDIDTVTVGDQLYRVAKISIDKADLGFAGDIQSISERTEVARGVSKVDVATIYATGAGYATFTVLSTDNKKALVNIEASKSSTTNEIEAKATVVKHDTTNVATGGLDKAIAADAVGAGIVRIEGNVLYALKEGSVDLAIAGESKLFYRISVVKDETTGQYSFTAPELVSKAVYTATELGLTDITSASSSDEAIATVDYASNKITITTQSKDDAGLITVNGPNGQAFIYMNKTGNTLYTEIEKATAKVDVSTGGLSNVSSLKEWTNEGIVRSYEAGTVLDFFVVQNGNTSYKVTDTAGKTTIINLPVTNNLVGHREIEAKVVKEEVGSKSGNPEIITPQDGEIISGTSVRLYKEADAKQYAYAIKTGDTLVKLADGTLVKYVVSISNGLYELTSETVTNGVTKTDTDLDLNGNLTITGIDSTIAAAVAVGKSITFHGQVQDGVTTALVTDGTKTVRVRITIVAGSMTVEPIKHIFNTGITAINIHETAKDIAWISPDGSSIYLLKEGVFRYIEHDSNSNTKIVKQLTITKAGTDYTVAGPVEVNSVVKTAADLGLVNALQVQGGYNTDVVYAGMVGTDFVAYQTGIGRTDVTVKDGQGQSTLLHMDADATLVATIAVAEKADNTVFTFAKEDYDLTDLVNITIANAEIAQKHSTNNQLYLLKAGTTYATLDDGAGNKALVSITVTKPADKLVATVKTIVKTASELAVGATTVSALPGAQTDTSIVRVAGNKVYAVGAGETKVKLDNQIVTVIVKEEANAYSITLGTVANFIEIPIGDGTYTLADLTNTNAVVITKDDKGTAADKTDDQLIISVNAANGALDLTITDNTGKKTVHHIKVENNIITKPPVTAVKVLTTSIADLGLANIDNDVVQLHGANLHLLKEGKAALEGSNGLVNVNVTRNTATKYLEVAQSIVQKEIKETITADTNYAFVEEDGKKYIRALQETNTPSIYYTTNYRIAANTQLVNDEYVLTVEERHKQEVDFASYGLTGALTLHSENEDLAKAELTADNKLVIYAGAGQITPTGTTTITAKDASNKQITIKVTRAEDGKISYVVQGQVDAIKFADINVTDVATKPVTVEGHNEAIVQATVTATGISLSAQTTGTTSLLIKQDNVVKAIVNITVADGKAVATVVKYDGTGLQDVITGDANIVRQEGTVYYATGEGVVLYDKGTTATQLRIVKNTETNLYSITPTSFALAKGATNLDLTINGSTTVNISNSSVVDAYVANGALYIVGKSLGSTDILVTTGADKAVVHAHMTASGLTANVVNSFTSTDTFTGTFEGNQWVQVRNDKLYALAVKTSTIKADDTLVTAEVTRNIDTNEFDVKLTRVKHKFNSAVTLVSDAGATEDAVIKINGDTIYAKAVGKTQVFENGTVRNIEVIANADGTYKIAVTEAKVQKIITGADLGLTLSASSNVEIHAIAGSNILETQVIDNNLYIYALGTGTAELVIDGKTIVHVSISSSNNVLAIAEPQIAKATITTGTIENIDPTDGKIRIDGNAIYGLQEGVSIVKKTESGKATLHKVLVVRENNVLKVSTSVIEKAFLTGDLTAIDNTIVRGGNGKLIAKATGEETFIHDGVTYRVEVDAATGDMNIEVLQTDVIDLSSVLASITGTPSSTLLQITMDGSKLNVTADKEGTEIIEVSGKSVAGPDSTIHVKVVVTKEGTVYKIAYELIRTELTTTQLGFHPVSVTPITNGYVKIDGSSIVIYPGKQDGSTITKKQYFTVSGNGGTQAIYSLDLDGITLVSNVVSGYKVEPLHRDIMVSELQMNPVQVAIDGTAKYSIKTKNGQEVLEVVLNNTNKSYIIVRSEDGSYKSIEVQATENGANDYTTSHTIHGTMALSKVTNMSPTGNVKSVNDGSKSVLYATAAGKFAYEEDGKLYNAEVTESNGKFSFTTGQVVTVALTNPRLVDGELNIQVDSSGTNAISKVGEAIYATDSGYKKVTATLNVNQQVEAIIEDVPSKTLPNTVVSATILKAPASIKLDGTTVFGGTVAEFADTVDAKDKVIIVSTVDGDGRVTLYKAIGEVDTATNEVSYVFTAITSDIFADIDWVNSTNYTVTKIDGESVARVKDNKVYFIGAGEALIIFKSETGLERTVKYEVNPDTFEVTVTKAENVIYFTREQVTDTRINLTFDLNVTNFPDGVDNFIVAPKDPQVITGVTRQDKNKILIKTNEIGAADNSETSGNLYIQLPEFSFAQDITVALKVKKEGEGYTITFDSTDFKFIQKTN